MKNQIKLFCIALAGAFMLTACGGPKLIGVTLPETPLVLATGETATAETSYTYDGETPENAQPEVVYTSGDAAIATVDENGVITGVAEGETTITATVGELSASRTVSVIIPVERLEAESMMLHLADGPASLTYTVVPKNFTGELTFASANNAIVTVDANGQITPVAVGDTNVTVTAPNGMTATAQIRVWDGPQELNLAPAKTEVTKGSGTQIGVTDEQGNDVEAESLTWASSDETVAQVSGGWVDVTGDDHGQYRIWCFFLRGADWRRARCATGSQHRVWRWRCLRRCQFRQLWSRWQFRTGCRCRAWLLDRVR